MELYIIRHGQTNHNKYMSMANKKPGDLADLIKPDSLDTELTEDGITETKNAIDLISDFCSHIYVSPAKRTLQTAEIIKESKFKHISYEIIDDLREIDYGGIEHMTDKEKIEKFGKKDFENILDFEDFGGEKYSDIRKRVQDFLDKAKSDGHERSIVVTSQGVIKMIYEILVGHITPTIAKYIRIKNSKVHLFQI